MKKIVADKIIKHIVDVDVFSESDLEAVKKSFTKHTQIFYCEKCSYNTFPNPRKSIISRNRFYIHPRCEKCKSRMNRVVVNEIDENSTVEEFLRKERPKIYCFIGAKNLIKDLDVSVVAVAEDGQGFSSHYSTTKNLAKLDIGLITNSHHEEYSEKYPKGYELIWVKENEIDTHEGLQEALKLNEKWSENK